MTQFNVGDTVGRHDLVTIHGKPVHLPDPAPPPTGRLLPSPSGRLPPPRSGTELI